MEKSQTGIEQIQKQKFLSLKMGNATTIFSKPFKGLENEILDFLKQKNPKRIVFLDTPPMQGALTAIEQIKEALPESEIVWIDHHDIENPSNPRDAEIANIAGQVREKIGKNAIIKTRAEYPAISLLLNEGQFNCEDTVIIADNDLDGLTGAMKASGIGYAEMDQDASVLDGPRSMQNKETLSEKAWLLVQGMATLPAFNPSAPHFSIQAKADLFKSFIDMIQGSAEAKSKLEGKVKEYESQVEVSKELLKKVEKIGENTLFIDTTSTSQRYDLASIAEQMEKTCKISVLKKSDGPIAKLHGSQFSLVVSKKDQAGFDIRSFLPEGFISSPESGIIANTPFMIHVSEKIWESEIKNQLENF